MVMFRDLKLRNVMDGFLKFKESVFTGLEECYCICGTKSSIKKLHVI